MAYSSKVRKGARSLVALRNIPVILPAYEMRVHVKVAGIRKAVQHIVHRPLVRRGLGLRFDSGAQ